MNAATDRATLAEMLHDVFIPHEPGKLEFLTFLRSKKEKEGNLSYRDHEVESQ